MAEGRKNGCGRQQRESLERQVVFFFALTGQRWWTACLLMIYSLSIGVGIDEPSPYRMIRSLQRGSKPRGCPRGPSSRRRNTAYFLLQRPSGPENIPDIRRNLPSLHERDVIAATHPELPLDLYTSFPSSSCHFPANFVIEPCPRDSRRAIAWLSSGPHPQSGYPFHQVRVR